MIVQLVVATGNRAGQIIPIPGEKFIIGRAEDCHLKPRSELISRYHCAILVGSAVTVRDLGSKNGVRLNGEKIISEQKLKNADKLTIGPLEFYVRIAANEDELLTIQASGSFGADVTRQQPTDGDRSDSGPGSSEQTVLLEHLKALNQELKGKIP